MAALGDIVDLDAHQLLDEIQAQLTRAKAALADENEGELRRAAIVMEYEAQRLAHLVMSW